MLEDIVFRAEKQHIDLPQSILKLSHDFENGLRADFPPESGATNGV